MKPGVSVEKPIARRMGQPGWNPRKETRGEHDAGSASFDRDDVNVEISSIISIVAFSPKVIYRRTLPRHNTTTKRV